MSNTLLALIRTWVPVAVGAALTWAAIHWGIVLPNDLSTELATAATGFVIALYYGAVKLLEKRWPWIGRVLLGAGAKGQPTYAAQSWGRRY